MHELEKTESRQATYKKYRQSEKGKKSRIAGAKRYREKYPEKVKAHSLSQAIEAKPCEQCGHWKVEKHHDDYSKPREVRFLCKKHHDHQHRRK